MCGRSFGVGLALVQTSSPIPQNPRSEVKSANRSATARKRAPQVSKEAPAETTPHHVLPVTVPCTVSMQVAECATETGLNPSEQFLRGIELFFNESKTRPSEETSQESTMVEGTPEVWTGSAERCASGAIQYPNCSSLPRGRQECRGQNRSNRSVCHRECPSAHLRRSRRDEVDPHTYQALRISHPRGGRQLAMDGGKAIRRPRRRGHQTSRSPGKDRPRLRGGNRRWSVQSPRPPHLHTSSLEPLRTTPRTFQRDRADNHAPNRSRRAPLSTGR